MPSDDMAKDLKKSFNVLVDILKEEKLVLQNTVQSIADNLDAANSGDITDEQFKKLTETAIKRMISKYK